MPAEAPAEVQAQLATHLTSVGIPTTLHDLFFQAVAAGGYTVQHDEAEEPAEVLAAVTCTVQQVTGRPGTFLVTVTDGDVELRWMEWHAKDGTITRSNVTAIVPA